VTETLLEARPEIGASQRLTEMAADAVEIVVLGEL